MEPRERAWLAAQQARLRAAAAGAGARTTAWDAVRNVRTWHLTAIGLLANMPKYDTHNCHGVTVFEIADGGCDVGGDDHQYHLDDGLGVEDDDEEEEEDENGS